MSDGTVRGSFELQGDQPLNTLRTLRTEAGRTKRSMSDLGTTMDRMALDTGRAWDSTRRSVSDGADRIEARIDKLDSRLERFGRTRAAAEVEIKGWDQANAQLIELERRLDKLSRQRATPSVALGGGFSNAVGGGGTFGGGLSSAGGGGGGFGRLGFAGKLAVGGALLSPGLQGLGVSSAALLGSAAGATLGAATVYGGAAATLGTGIGLTATVAKPAIKSLQELQKEQVKYTQAVERYGAASKQAAVAREALTRAEAKDPGAAVASRQIGLFRSEFRSRTAPGRAAVFGAIGNVAVAGRSALPNIGRQTNRAATASSSAVSNYAGFLAGEQSQRTLAGLTTEFVRDLPIVERDLQNLTSTAEHLAMAARPFFHEATVWSEKWTHSLSTNTSNEARLQQTMHGLVEETKDWGRLAGATYRTVRDIFDMGRPSGDSMVVELTTTLDRWDSWIQRNPAKVERFFREAQTTTTGVAGALTSIVKLLSQAATALDPIFNRATGLIKIVTALGPGVTTLGSAALYGAYGGFRGSGAAGGSRVGSVLRTGLLGSPYRGGGGAPGGGVLIAGGARASAGTSRMVGEGVYNVRPSSVVSARTGGGFIAGPGAVSARPSEMFAEANTARDMGPFVGIAERGNPLKGLGGRVADSRVGSAAASGIKTIGATLAIMAALESLGRGGSVGETVQNFGSSFTLGLLHPTDNSGQKGQARATTFLGGIPTNYSAARAQSVVGRKIARVLGTGFTQNESFAEQFGNTEDEAARERKRTFHGVHLNPASSAFPTEVGQQIKVLEAIPGGHAKNQVQELRQLLKTWQENKQAADAYRKSRDEALDYKSVEHAGRISSQLGASFRVETTHGKSPVAAATDITSGALASMRSMREAGRKVLGENTLAWAQQLAKGNPELEGVVHDLTSKIKRQFQQVDKDVQIVNGHILTGTAEQWQSISTAMSEPLEKARERMSKSFTAIQQEAVGALVAMGFNRKGAQSVISGMEKGGPSPGQIAGKVTTGVGALAGGITSGLGAKNARGGMIGGSGLTDHVDVPGGKAAPGEAWIANRHTMNDLSRATIEKFGKTAWQMIQGESRPHSMPMRYSLGGASLSSSTGSGALSGVRSGVRSVAEAIISQFPGLSVTSTTGGKHAPGSLHYLGEAVDLAGGNSTMLSAAAWTGRNYGRSLAEGIHNPNLSVKNGANVSPSYWGSQVWGEHANHIHVGVIGGGGARGAASGYGNAGAATGALRALHLHPKGSGLGGVPGLLANAGISKYAHALEGRVNHKLASAGGGGSFAGVPGRGGSPSANERLGRSMMIAAGWGSGEWPALQALWTQESGWNANSVNSSSGAYGIPQALGHGHPFNLGDARGQIAWGLNYIRGRYGSPGAAEAHERSYNWYSRGGHSPVSWGGWNAAGGEFETRGPTIFGAGEGGKREHVSIKPLNSSPTKGAHSITVKIERASFATGADIDQVAREVAAKILAAIDDVGESDTSDRELIGR